MLGEQTEPRRSLKHRLWGAALCPKELPVGLGPGRGRRLRATSTLKDKGISCPPFWKVSGIHGNSVFTFVLGNLFSSFPDCRYKEPIFCRGPIRQEQGINERGGKSDFIFVPGRNIKCSLTQQEAKLSIIHQEPFLEQSEASVINFAS